MFNLLRRSRRQKLKDQHNNTPNASTNKHLANEQPTTEEATSPLTTRGAAERYRRLSDAESDSWLPMFSEPTAPHGRKATIRAAIAELEDLGDLDNDGDGGGGGDERGATNANNADNNKHDVRNDKQTRRWGGALEDYLYDGKRRNKHEDLERRTHNGKEKKVNLAKVAATHIDTHAHTQPNAKQTTAIKQKTNKVFAFSKVNVDRINNLAAVATRSIGNAGDDGNDEVVASDAASRCGAAIEVDTNADAEQFASAHSQTSRNEKAEWQGHVSTFGNCNLIDKTANDFHSTIEEGVASRQQQFNNSNRQAAAISAEDAEWLKGSNSNNSNNSSKNTRNSTCNGNGSRSSNCHSNTGTATDAVTVAATVADTSINEVKYRNLGKRNSDTKRQSRLSLTLVGLNLGKSKSATDKHEKKPQQAEVGHHSRRISSLFQSSNGNKVKTTNNGSRDANKENTTHNSPEHKRPNSKLFFINYKSNDKIKESTDRKVENVEKSSEVDRKLRPLQRSKEFFSDIFMARGRNHNRNRNHHTQTQTQTQTQQIQPQQQQTHHYHNHQPQQQQQQDHIIQAQQQHPSPHKQGPCKYETPTQATTPAASGHLSNKSQHNDTIITNNQHKSVENIENSPRSTHLETISDPAATNAHSANTYQMTMSNNSSKNFNGNSHNHNHANGNSHSQSNNATSRVDCEQDQPQQSMRSQHAHWSPWRRMSQERSNSADRVRAVNWADMQPASGGKRALSVEPSAGGIQRQFTETETSRSNSASNPRLTTSSRSHSMPQPLNCANGDERSFIHAPSIVRHGVHTIGTAASAAYTRDSSTVNGSGNTEEHFERAAASKTKQQQQPQQQSVVVGRDGNAKRQLTELTECKRASVPLPSSNGSDSVNLNRAYNVCAIDQDTSPSAASSMGQTSAKPETETPPSTRRASTPREFRESIISGEGDDDGNGQPKVVPVPKIICMDYSDADGGACATTGSSSSNDSPVEKEVFYDFENAMESKFGGSINITPVDDADDGIEEGDYDEVFYKHPASTGCSNKWSSPPPPAISQAHLRSSYVKLEDVPEGEEEYDDEHNLDHELYGNQFDSPERSPLKSSKSSDSNLSTSFPDSGIGDTHPSTSSSTTATAQFTKRLLGDNEKVSPSRTTIHTTRQQHQHQHQHQEQQRVPFVRDGYSTDCDETLLQYDDLEYMAETQVDINCLNDERLVCIESISLPDVVVESTTGTSAGSSLASAFGGSGGGSSGGGNASGGEHIININGATGNSIGNVHFIPMHIEGDTQSSPQKRRSIDDSVIGSGGMKSYNQLNGLHQNNTTIEEIIEDASDTDCGKLKKGFHIDGAAEKLKRELIEQKSRFNVQLEGAQQNVHNLQGKVNEMQTKIEQLEQELSTKAWNVERLQGELKAAHKEDEYVRKRLKMLEDEKTILRHKHVENEEELRQRIAQLEKQYKELEEKYKQTHQLASSLQIQLAAAQSEAEEWREEVDRIRGDLEEQIRILQSALENSEAERKICEDKWQREFEMLRTQNLDREESLMTDCEWQLRQMQKQCKDKADKFQHERHIAMEKAEMLGQELEEKQQEVEDLKVYQAEVTALRGVVSEQEYSIQGLMQQIELLKSDLQAANENLERQIEAVRKIKYQCDNALYDKERQMIYRIDEVRNEAAAFWENKLYTEMTRLKNELESVYVDERREALDKLQAEHIEELRALTTRYTANEEELRVELAELQESFEIKNAEFLELREKSDSALLQTRMHLDKADREYQNAMFREGERREVMEEKLRKEFEEEKEQMEENFRERLNEIKEEFAIELEATTDELSAQHKKDLEKQKAKLQAQKDEAIQELVERHRKKLAAAEEQMQDIELRHQRDLKDLKATYDEERIALDKRDISNASEIEQLHRKCRCLTNLFEEMRIRYERRDPRHEDLREIEELRSRCESQERDLHDLTFQLREMQMKMAEMQPSEEAKLKKIQKPPPKKIPTTCDVIYEENEERESPPPTTSTQSSNDDAKEQKKAVQQENEESEEEEVEDDENEGDDDDDEEEEEDEEDEEEEEQKESTPTPVIGMAAKDSKSKTQKNVDLINEDDSHMITAV